MFKENILKVVVFDLGGTLMQYIGMPYSWVDFYFMEMKMMNLEDAKKEWELM